ncbi:MAG: AMP-binding protein [Leptolyngbyaceae bacterium]|nr:AMP-binding protein [Leptolyngbyaceae bacterium]
MMRITDGLLHHGAEHPEKLAIQMGSSKRTYGDLVASVRTIASSVATLRESSQQFKTIDDPLTVQNLRPCVGLLLPNGVEFLETFLGTALAGGVAMVLNPEWPATQRQSMLSRWIPDVLVQSPSHHLWEQSDTLTDTSSGTSTNTSSGDSTTRLHLPLSGQTPFYIGFTSGTTGTPKGVIRHHSSWVQSFQSAQVEFAIEPDDQIWVPGSWVHSLSLYTAVETLVNGATLHGMTAFTPKAILRCLTQQPITRIVAVPALLKAIAHVVSRKQIHVPTLRTIISGGSKLSPDLRSQLQHLFPSADIFEYYGASELSFISLASSREPIPPESVGRPFHGVDVSVRREDGTVAQPNEIGWIGIRSDMVCSGYLEAMDGTGFRVDEGWATVGDRGWLDEAGYLYLVGRERDMLIANGINVYPAEIEAVLMSHPLIDEAVVLGLPDDCRGDIICAVMTVNVDDPILETKFDRSALSTFLTKHLEPAKCPRQFFVTDAFPLTTSGKVNREELKRQILGRSPFLYSQIV